MPETALFQSIRFSFRACLKNSQPDEVKSKIKEYIGELETTDDLKLILKEKNTDIFNKQTTLNPVAPILDMVLIL